MIRNYNENQIYFPQIVLNKEQDIFIQKISEYRTLT